MSLIHYHAMPDYYFHTIAIIATISLMMILPMLPDVAVSYTPVSLFRLLMLYYDAVYAAFSCRFRLLSALPLPMFITLHAAMLSAIRAPFRYVDTLFMLLFAIACCFRCLRFRC